MPTVLIVSAWFILGLQMIFLVCFLVAFWRRKPTPIGSTPPVSIIVCAHDEENNLRKLVHMLLDQDYPQFEVIVVEDRCNDGTYDYLLEQTHLHANLKMVRVQHLPEHVNGKKFALTLGIKAASYEWLLLTDADSRPAGNQWVRMMASHFGTTRQIVIGYSPYFRLRGYLNAFVRFESLITGIQFIGWALLNRPYMGVGRNLAYRKSLFLDNKGFNKYLRVTGGDDDLFVNEHATPSNTAVSIDPGSLTRSEPKKSWREFFHQKIRHLHVGKRYKLSDKVLLSLFSFTWILSWLFVLPVMLQAEVLGTFLWVGFLLRELLLMGLVYRASRTLGEAFEVWKTPLLDFNYAIYYLGTGLVALVSKRVRWKI